MTAARANAYGNVTALLRELGPAKLTQSEQERIREAADELAVPVGTVKSRLHSAVKRLGEAWAQTHPAANN